MRAALATAALALTAGAAVADDAAARKMLKGLEGTYTPVSMTQGGTPLPDAVLKAATFEIKGNMFTARFGKGGKEEVKEATIVLDPGPNPAAIDLTPKAGPDAGKPMLGIIKVERDTVTLCWTDEVDKAQRPKDFSSTAGSRDLLIVMKKAR